MTPRFETVSSVVPEPARHSATGRSLPCARQWRLFVTIRPMTRTECSGYDRRSVVILALLPRQYYNAVLTGHRRLTAWRYR
jgi:hypothetical protein